MFEQVQPRLLSDWLEQALQDLRTCEADSRYRVGMFTWCRYNPDERVCQVCLAGSLLVQSLHWPMYQTCFYQIDGGQPAWALLRALNWLRCGELPKALASAAGSPLVLHTARLQQLCQQGLPEFLPPSSYHLAREAFFRDMQRVWHQLRHWKV